MTQAAEVVVGAEEEESVSVQELERESVPGKVSEKARETELVTGQVWG
jgi:hypothetical protein